jgi:hypothetical protein
LSKNPLGCSIFLLLKFLTKFKKSIPILCNPIDEIEDIEEPIAWQNFASSPEGIPNLFKNFNLDMGDLRLTDSSKIQTEDSLFVSVFLFNILETQSVKGQSMYVFLEPNNHYSYSENGFQFIVAVHSSDHLLAINTIIPQCYFL